MLEARGFSSCRVQAAERGCAPSSVSFSSSSSVLECHHDGPVWSDHTHAENPLSLKGERI